MSGNYSLHNVKDILFMYSHSIFKYDAASFNICCVFLYSFVPCFGINKSTIFLKNFFLYILACQGFSVFLVFAFVEPLSFNFLTSIYDIKVINNINICTIIPDFPKYQFLTNEKFDTAQLFNGSNSITGAIAIKDKL